MANFVFNAEQHEPVSLDNSVIPKGWYPAIVTASDVGPTSNGLGIIAKFTFEVVDGPNKGKKVFTNFNVKNPTETAQRIGLGMLSSLAKACNRPQFDDTTELHNIHVLIKVDIDPGNEKYAERNKIVDFKNAGEKVTLAWENPKCEPPSAFPAFNIPHKELPHTQASAPENSVVQPLKITAISPIDSSSEVVKIDVPIQPNAEGENQESSLTLQVDIPQVNLGIPTGTPPWMQQSDN